MLAEYEKFLRGCKVLPATKRVWDRGRSARPIKSSRFIIRFWFGSSDPIEMERHGSKKEVESFAFQYAKQMFVEEGQQPWRIEVSNY